MSEGHRAANTRQMLKSATGKEARVWTSQVPHSPRPSEGVTGVSGLPRSDLHGRPASTARPEARGPAPGLTTGGMAWLAWADFGLEVFEVGQRCCKVHQDDVQGLLQTRR